MLLFWGLFIFEALFLGGKLRFHCIKGICHFFFINDLFACQFSSLNILDHVLYNNTLYEKIQVKNSSPLKKIKFYMRRNFYFKGIAIKESTKIRRSSSKEE